MKSFTEKLLEKFTFVKWDRLTEDSAAINFYGWIDRKQDSYKDFIVVTIWKGIFRKFPQVWFVTSSKKYDKKIVKILRLSKKDHTPCKRVENYYLIKNSIHLIKPLKE